jgi:CRP-like cAMP-binding protein
VKIPQQPAGVPPLLLDGLSDADSHAVLSAATCHSYPVRTVLCRQGERGRHLFLIQSGRARFARTTAEGRSVLLRWIGPGDCFGMASLLPDTVNYMATAVTLEKATVYVWEGASIRAAAARCPRLSQNALRIALEYLEEFSARHVALLSRTAEQRVARTLTHLGSTNGRVLPEGVQVAITNEELASLADVGMFTVSRQMKRWERDGLVVKQRGRVLIRHPESLLAV